jgi:hypothetical protein
MKSTKTSSLRTSKNTAHSQPEKNLGSKRCLGKKKPTLSKLTKELDKVFSIYIRKKYADKDGIVACYTCGVRKPWKEQQCGHFVSRAHRSVRWEHKNVRVQCYACNVMRSGNLAEFTVRLQKECGGEFVDDLLRMKHHVVKFSTVELQNLIDWYKGQIK